MILTRTSFGNDPNFHTHESTRRSAVGRCDQYVPPALNPSVYFSRMPNKGEWSLEAELAQDLMHRWGRCTVDRFAVALSAQYAAVGA